MPQMSQPVKQVVILHRGRDFIDQEFAAARAAGFTCTHSRVCVDPGDLVIARYAALPHYDEVADDVALRGGRLINTLAEHTYLADMGQWYDDLRDFTPRTWRSGDYIPENAGPHGFVLKGQTNSKKFLWDTHMFARTRQDVGRVLSQLLDDSLISTQQIYVREFLPLKTYGVGLHGLPITKEFRFFVHGHTILSGAFYWSNAVEDLGVPVPSVDEVPPSLLASVIEKIAPHATFFVVDVAQTADGDWIVVELNDGQQSGLSENDPYVLYPALMKSLNAGV